MAVGEVFRGGPMLSSKELIMDCVGRLGWAWICIDRKDAVDVGLVEKRWRARTGYGPICSCSWRSTW